MNYIYVAVLEKDSQAHYFKTAEGAENYLKQWMDPECYLDPNSTHENGEVWSNVTDESVGYYYRAFLED